MNGIKGYPGRIAQALRETGIRQKELAVRAKMCPETLCRKLKNPEQFKGDEMERIREVFRWKTIGGEQ